MLIFLDLDGVMIPAKGWKAPELLDDGFPAFSSKAAKALQNLLSEEATVLLTTSHKSKYDVEQWKKIFRNRAVSVSNLRVLPPNDNNISRKEEIIAWFSANPTNEDFIIIDDDKSLNDLPGFLKENLILTSPYIGLTEIHLEHLVKKVS